MQGQRKFVKILTQKHNIQPDQTEEQVVFRYHRPVNQSPHEELIISQIPKKRQKLNVQKLDQEEQLCEDFMSKLSIKHSVQYFLKRVEKDELQKYSQMQDIVRNSLMPKAAQIAQRNRFSMRQAMMNKARGIKIMQLNKEYVELGGKKIEVEDLGKIDEDYYILKKRTNIKEGKFINLPEGAQKMLQKVPFQEQQNTNMEEQQHDDEDSNRQSNPDYEYPDEESSYSSENEGIVGERGYNSDSQQSHNSQVELDEEELYRRYLRRCKKEESDDDMEYFEA